MRVEIERVAYILNSRSRFQSMPGKNLIGMPEFVDPAAATEPIADYIGRASVITGGMDIADDPIKPPPADYLHATQSDLVASTSQPVGLGGPTTTQGEVGIVPAARQLPVAAHSMQRAEKGLTVLAATLAGILHILALFILYTGITTTFSLRLNKDAMPDKPANTPVVALASKPCENVKNAPSEMVCIDGGEFIMGRDGKIQEEKPEHKETVGPFLMDKYEVTNEEYAKFVVETNRFKMPQGWKKKY